MTLSERQIAETLEKLGYKKREIEQYPWWTRLMFRLMGPHEWTPLYHYKPHSGALTEEGCICDICHKEMA